MRKADLYGMRDDAARALLDAADHVHLATTDEAGGPILRTMNHARVGDLLGFHAAPVGEKMSGLGRPAVASTERVLALIPSYFVDPVRACPATTYYESAMVHGTLVALEEPEQKAAVMAALMAKLQPEGGHAPLDAASPVYAKALGGLAVFALRVERIAGKAKVGQNRTPADRVRVALGLWRRGAPGDAAAIEALLRYNPDTPLPDFLRSPVPGVRLVAHLDAADAARAASLLEGEYWLTDVPREVTARAFERSAVTVGAKTEAGELVAVARATSDGKTAWIYDVMVAPSRRGSGLGRALVALLCDHPAVRGAAAVRLSTRDAENFYRELGFRTLAESPRPGFTPVEMIVRRPLGA